MPRRVITLLLAFVVLWSGLNTVEVPRVLAHASSEQMPSMWRAGDPSAAHEGSVEHHHLDDLPSQTQSDPPTETPGMPPSPLPSGAPSAAAAPHGRFASAEAGAPCLAGLLRPPCDAAFAG